MKWFRWCVFVWLVWCLGSWEGSNGLVLHGSKVLNSAWNMNLDVKVMKNSTIDLVVITITGPTGRWFGVGFGNKVMSGTYALVSTGSGGGLSERKLGTHTSGSQLTSSITTISNQAANGIRTIIVTRSTKGTNSNYYTFPTTATTSVINLIVARGESGATSLAYHGSSNKIEGLQLTLQVVSTDAPTKSPTKPPTKKPTLRPTKVPTKSPTDPPTKPPTLKPTKPPSQHPTLFPTGFPTLPTTEPTASPTNTPTTPIPSKSPTKAPTKPPTTPRPTLSPTRPTRAPTQPPTPRPTHTPTTMPTTASPTSRAPTSGPTAAPTADLIYYGSALLNSKFEQKAYVMASREKDILVLDMYGQDDSTWFAMGFNAELMYQTYAVVILTEGGPEERRLGDNEPGNSLDSSFSLDNTTTVSESGILHWTIPMEYSENMNFNWSTLFENANGEDFEIPVIWSKGQNSVFDYHGENHRGVSSMAFSTRGYPEIHANPAAYVSHVLALWSGIILLGYLVLF